MTEQIARPRTPESFEWQGAVYVRPLGRGICLDGQAWQLEDIPAQGFYQMEIRLVPIEYPEGFSYGGTA